MEIIWARREGSDVGEAYVSGCGVVSGCWVVACAVAGCAAGFFVALEHEEGIVLVETSLVPGSC